MGVFLPYHKLTKINCAVNKIFVIEKLNEKQHYPLANHYLVSIIFFAASAYLASCLLASLTYFGCVNLTGISLIISLYIDWETSGVQLLGNIGSPPLSIIFLSNSHLLNDSGGASIPMGKNV